MVNPNDGRKYKKPKLPKAIVIMYALMIIVLLGICTGVFIVLFSNVSENQGKSQNSSESAAIIESSSAQSEKPVSSSAESSSESIIFTSDSGSEYIGSTDSSTESTSTSNIIYTPSETLSESFDRAFFEDDLFIGDSIFTGLYLYDGYLAEKNVAAAVGYTPYGAMSKAIDSKGMTALEYAKEMQPKRIFIMLGSNALSGGSHSGLEESYRELVSRLMGACPNTDICCISITPTARYNDYPNIDNSEVREVNAVIKSMCSELGLKYCDLYSLISDEDGYFRDDYAEVDGMHFLGKTYAVLLSALQKIMS